MSSQSKHIVIIAGEASGDIRAAELVREMKKQNSSLTFSGLGGQEMKQAGVDIYTDLTQLALIGFAEVLKHYFQIRRIFYSTLQKIEQLQPTAVILIDYPGFNLRLAKALKKKKIKVFYYISPQVWAWKENRVESIKNNVDKIYVLFDFEKDFYEERGTSVEFVGHPLVDALHPSIDKNAFLSSHSLLEEKLTIGLLPGSRKKEVQTILPIMLKAAKLIAEDKRKVQFLLMKAPTIDSETFKDLLSSNHIPLTIVDKKITDGINACDLCLVTSGTATLETAILCKPMVIIYKTSFITWILAKFLIKIPFIGLVNIVARKKIVPECIQYQASPENIALEMKKFYQDEGKIIAVKDELKKVKLSLGESGASFRTAKSILNSLGIH